ncbi:MAG TPA: hypothetical protein VFZ09_50820 [Archangium sp.]|uniref:HEAT repeat domain-containing protein n=1 Tax=Archangium sp. TaxID=1872627 RepID=UPI002E31C56D|nr:hypothetical protein [Archangium sp.]HEX5754580.1 hypothetical protein [Archangium sp.]
MTSKTDTARMWAELVDAVGEGDETQARALVRELNARPRRARALLEAMLDHEDARVRQAGAFGLGELGGTASVRRLEKQLQVEESRGGYDAASVIEIITESLGRIADISARGGLLRQLERLTGPRVSPSEVNTLARALWRSRHPELRPAVQRALDRLPPAAAASLRGLWVLLEKSPGQLRAWVEDVQVPVALKAEVLPVLEEEVPDEWVDVLPAFISLACAQAPSAVPQLRGDALCFCERLFILLMLDDKRLLMALPAEAREQLRETARTLVAAKSLRCALWAATVLQYVGQPEDVLLLEAHRPEDATFAEVFDRTIQSLRSPPSG